MTDSLVSLMTWSSFTSPQLFSNVLSNLLRCSSCVLCQLERHQPILFSMQALSSVDVCWKSSYHASVSPARKDSLFIPSTHRCTHTHTIHKCTHTIYTYHTHTFTHMHTYTIHTHAHTTHTPSTNTNTHHPQTPVPSIHTHISTHICTHTHTPSTHTCTHAHGSTWATACAFHSSDWKLWAFLCPSLGWSHWYPHSVFSPLALLVSLRVSEIHTHGV